MQMNALSNFISEKQFQEQVIDLFKTFKWEIYHAWNSQNSTSKGFPDLVCIRKGSLVFAELKVDGVKARVSPQQQWWLDELKKVQDANSTVRAYLWHPSDWNEVTKVAAWNSQN